MLHSLSLKVAQFKSDQFLCEKYMWHHIDYAIWYTSVLSNSNNPEETENIHININIKEAKLKIYLHIIEHNKNFHFNILLKCIKQHDLIQI